VGRLKSGAGCAAEADNAQVRAHVKNRLVTVAFKETGFFKVTGAFKPYFFIIKMPFINLLTKCDKKVKNSF
jgi:hypothetical protein